MRRQIPETSFLLSHDHLCALISRCSPVYSKFFTLSASVCYDYYLKARHCYTFFFLLLLSFVCVVYYVFVYRVQLIFGFDVCVFRNSLNPCFHFHAYGVSNKNIAIVTVSVRSIHMDFPRKFF